MATGHGAAIHSARGTFVLLGAADTAEVARVISLRGTKAAVNLNNATAPPGVSIPWTAFDGSAERLGDVRVLDELAAVVLACESPVLVRIFFTLPNHFLPTPRVMTLRRDPVKINVLVA
jgi:hypothetical protein